MNNLNSSIKLMRSKSLDVSESRTAREICFVILSSSSASPLFLIFLCQVLTHSLCLSCYMPRSALHGYRPVGLCMALLLLSMRKLLVTF
ncbi:unnamed protein product [Linum trigynum]|uniref:Uncharacterized protein n=1 Tax=Linum trigynum TaxID=586398 RepID=A0AAV2CLY0_9ROSI